MVINQWVTAVGNWGSILLGTSEKPFRTFFIIIYMEDREATMLSTHFSTLLTRRKHRLLHYEPQITDHILFSPLVNCKKRVIQENLSHTQMSMAL